MAGSWDSGVTRCDMLAATGASLQIELVGMHLRVRGTIDIGRFQRLSDRINHGGGYIKIGDARLLKRNGDPTPLVVDELYVNQDEITFIALAHATDEVTVADPSQGDRPLIEKLPRRFLVFT